MESLGHYLLRDRIALPGNPPPGGGQSESVAVPGAPFEVFEGQDVRTGISVLMFKPMPGNPPKLELPGALLWVEGQEGAWIAEIPVGAVQTSWLAGRVEPARLLAWTRQLLGAVHACQSQNIPVGWIVPELVWARGSRVWLGGVGAAGEHRWDYAGLLNTLRVIAGDTYPALPWREPLEAFVTGKIEYEDLEKRLEALSSAPTVPASQSAQEIAPTQDNPQAEFAAPEREELSSPLPKLPQDRAGKRSRKQRRLEAKQQRAAEFANPQSASQPQPEPVEEETESTSTETERVGPVSKALKVQVGEAEAPPAEPSPAPKRIRIEDTSNPSFEVIEPPRQGLSGRRGVLALLIIVPLLLLAAGAYFFLQPRPQAGGAGSGGYTVEFRLQPPGPKANIEVLEVPEGSKIPLNTVLAEVPGSVKFDVSGIYRIRVRVQGRAPVDSIISVPNPSGVSINLR